MVKTTEEASEIIHSRFPPLKKPPERVSLEKALGRILHEDITTNEYVPGFNRSTVDGYAVIASDTFGSSPAIPALLTQTGEVLMGGAADGGIKSGECFAVSTGGDLPDCADAVVMLEYTEQYGGGLIGVTQPSAPGSNIILKGGDVSPGDTILRAGQALTPHDIGVLAALGITQLNVAPRPLFGIISTGDELIAADRIPGRGQIRDVNTPMLAAKLESAGAEIKSCGIIRDTLSGLKEAFRRAVLECDAVIISGGSSAGVRDLTARVIEESGELLFHGIAIKPGKPTILGAAGAGCLKPVFGLPGNPVAAYFVTEIFVRPLITRLMGGVFKRSYTIPAQITEAVSSNHGRAEYIPVSLTEDSGVTARPIRGKSGLIATLAGSDGYICIPRDCEGLPKKATVQVTLW